MLAQGVPMLAHGDEANRTQGGNNNAYAQDNEITWMRWDHTEEDEALIEFTSRLIELRKAEPLLRRRRYFRGQPDAPDALKDVAWLRPDGQEMAHEDWENPDNASLIFRLSGTAINEPDELGGQIRTSSLLVIMHNTDEPLEVTLPEPDGETGQLAWEMVITSDDEDAPVGECFQEGCTITVPARTVLVFRGMDG
jgi:glycogen operon protein